MFPTPGEKNTQTVKYLTCSSAASKKAVAEEEEDDDDDNVQHNFPTCLKV